MQHVNFNSPPNFQYVARSALFSVVFFFVQGDTGDAGPPGPRGPPGQDGVGGGVGEKGEQVCHFTPLMRCVLWWKLG